MLEHPSDAHRPKAQGKGLKHWDGLLIQKSRAGGRAVRPPGHRVWAGEDGRVCV